MNKFYTSALAAAFLTASMLGTASANPDHGNGNGQSNGHAKSAAAHGKSSSEHGKESAAHGHKMAAPKGYAASHMSGKRSEKRSNESKERGKSESAHRCVNPAGHTRGWCKGTGTYRGRYGSRSTSISGTVTAVNGNLVTFLRDNGTVVTVLDNNGTVLNVGGHYTLVGRMVNGQFVLNSNNDRYGQSNQTVSGTILAVGNGTVTLIGLPPTTINVQQAINNGATNGALTLGRSITAYGYYSNNVFYATAIR